MIVVVKIGTSSLTDEMGNLEVAQIESLVQQIAELKKDGKKVVLVTSAAIAAGKPALNIAEQPSDYLSLQALATIGQSRLLSIYEKELNSYGLVGGQVLVTLEDFSNRKHYLRIRAVLEKLLELGVVPIVNENDAITDEEIRFGDNDRLAAMVAHLVRADKLILLTDTEGVYTADPRLEKDAELIREIDEINKELEKGAGGTQSDSARGGMASKLAAARIASWSGISCIIASSFLENVLAKAVSGESVGTTFKPKDQQLSSKKLWIGFAAPVCGVATVDDGAKKAVVEGGKSLLPVGVVSVEGEFESGDALEVKDLAGEIIAKGLTNCSSAEFEKATDEFIHRDDLVILV